MRDRLGLVAETGELAKNEERLKLEVQVAKQLGDQKHAVEAANVAIQILMMQQDEERVALEDQAEAQDAQRAELESMVNYLVTSAAQEVAEVTKQHRREAPEVAKQECDVESASGHWFRGQPSSNADDAEIARWFRGRPEGAADWLRRRPAGAADWLGGQAMELDSPEEKRSTQLSANEQETHETRRAEFEAELAKQLHNQERVIEGATIATRLKFDSLEAQLGAKDAERAALEELQKQQSDELALMNAQVASAASSANGGLANVVGSLQYSKPDVGNTSEDHLYRCEFACILSTLIFSDFILSLL